MHWSLLGTATGAHVLAAEVSTGLIADTYCCVPRLVASKRRICSANFATLSGLVKECGPLLDWGHRVTTGTSGGGRVGSGR